MSYDEWKTTEPEELAPPSVACSTCNSDPCECEEIDPATMTPDEEAWVDLRNELMVEIEHAPESEIRALIAMDPFAPIDPATVTMGYA